MSFDFYKLRLMHALWTWREGRHCRYHSKMRHKDRIMGRADKRAARQQERRDIKEEC